MISLFKKGLQELSDSNLSQGWELGVHRKPFTMYQEKHWIGTGSSGFFFFQSSMQPAGVIHLSGKFGRMIDKVDHPACSTVKVCAFMRVDACHFPEFSCYQCSF